MTKLNLTPLHSIATWIVSNGLKLKDYLLKVSNDTTHERTLTLNGHNTYCIYCRDILEHNEYDVHDFCKKEVLDWLASQETDDPATESLHIHAGLRIIFGCPRCDYTTIHYELIIFHTDYCDLS